MLELPILDNDILVHKRESVTLLPVLGVVVMEEEEEDDEEVVVVVLAGACEGC